MLIHIAHVWANVIAYVDVNVNIINICYVMIFVDVNMLLMLIKLLLKYSQIYILTRQ